MSQASELLTRLKKGSVTPRSALSELGIMRLAARIKDLRDAGHFITTQRVNVKTRHGKTVVAQYTLMRKRK